MDNSACPAVLWRKARSAGRGGFSFTAAVTALAFGGYAPNAFSAPPTLDHFYPVAIQRDATQSISAVGKFDAWPPKIWTDAPGISITPDKEKGTLNVEVSQDTAVGPHLVRFFNEEGSSAPRFLIVTTQPTVLETEPNDHFSKAPPIDQLPTTIDGRLGKSGDVDSYAVTLAAGQTVIASVEAYRLGSPLDAVLRLVDARGLEMAVNHDDGRTLDPALAWTAKKAGTYIVQVFGFAFPATSAVNFTGSDACVYRLHVSTGPQARYTLPLGLQRGHSAKLQVFGWNLGGFSGRAVDVDGSFPEDGSARAGWRRPDFENTFFLPLGDGPEWQEQDLRKGSGDSPALSPPYAITGSIEKPEEEDRFVFTAKKDEKLLFEIQSTSLGFPLDAWLAVQDKSGKELAKNDDSTDADPVLEWAAPQDGAYVAVVKSVLHRSGADHLYRLSVRPVTPDFKGVVAESGFTIEPGKTIEIKITARRSYGFATKLAGSVTGLPEGLTAGPFELGEKDKEVVLKLTASAEAAPFSGPFEIQFKDENTHTAFAGVHELVSSSLRNGVPRGFRDLVITSTPGIWLTVVPPPPPKEADKK